MANKLQNGIDPTAHVNGAQPATVSGQIYAAIHNGHLAVNKLTAAKNDATTAVDTGKAATYTKLAQLAYDSDWTNAAIKEQITILRAKDNAKGKNYFGEVSKVMDVNVRFHVPAFFKLAKTAWDQDSDTMNKAHKRQLHYVLNFLIPAALDSAKRVTLPANATEAVAAAKARLADPNAQVKADFAAIERMATALTELHKRYEGTGLGAVGATLAGVTLGTLDIARKKAAITEAQVNEQAATIEAARVARGKPTKVAVEQPAATPLPGAIDIEALMAGMASMQQQIAALVAVTPKTRAARK